MILHIATCYFHWVRINIIVENIEFEKKEGLVIIMANITDGVFSFVLSSYLLNQKL